MEPTAETLTMWGNPSEDEPLDWDWARERLEDGGTYWLTVADPSGSVPHPRPVWGVWSPSGDPELLPDSPGLYLSVGTPKLNRLIDAGGSVSVNLSSGVDVVIVEGVPVGKTAARQLVHAYDAKYDWRYDAEVYGELVAIRPSRVIAWRATGEAGRDGFGGTRRFVFPD